MNIIRYGSVYLNVLEVHTYKREAVYAGNDYLYTRHTLGVRAVFNPKTQRDLLRGESVTWGTFRPDLLALPGGTGPIVGPHSGGPVVTDTINKTQIFPVGVPAGERPGVYTSESVKHVLLQPRLQLRWVWQGQPVLTSPLQGYAVDSTNGPRPLSCDVVEMHSGKTWIVDWVVQTDISQCPQFSEYPEPILSNQWSMSHDLDQDFYTIRTIEGRVVFDATLVRGLRTAATDAIRPDDLRPLFVFPVPLNMKRESVQVRLAEDGVTLHYRVVDKETALNINSNIVTRVEAVHQIHSSTPDITWGAGASAGARFGWNTSLHVAGSLDAGVRLPWLGGGAVKGTLAQTWDLGTSANLSANLGVSGRTSLSGFTPFLATTAHRIVVRVWGTRSSNRNQLEDFAREIIDKRIAPIRITIGYAVDFKVAHDLMGSFIEAEAIYLTGPMGWLGFSSKPIPTHTLGRRVFSPDNNTGDLLVTSAATQTLRPPHDNKSRGTYLENLVTAALTGPCRKTPNVNPTVPADTAPSNPDWSFTSPSWPKPSRPVKVTE